jgi:branched-chain amino acid transport system permease protein
MDLLISAIVYGIITGSVLAVGALGFNLQFGVTNYANFAYGPFLTFAAYMVFVLNGEPFQIGFWPAEVGAVLATGLLSFLIGNFVFTPFFKRRPQLLFGLAVTFSMAIIIDGVIDAIWGSYVHEVAYPVGALTVHRLGNLSVTNLDIAFVGLAVLVFGATHLLLRYTRLGRMLRAMSDNEQLAIACGIRTRRMTAITWALTGVLAGIAGVAYELEIRSFDPTLGDNVFYILVAAVIFGGIGRPFGSIVGAVAMGIVSQVGVLIVGEAYSTVSIFVVLVALMLVRPDGVFGARARSVFATA